MKKFLSVFLILIFSIGIYAQSSNILFLGNSYTYENNLPQLVRNCYQSTGDDAVVNMSASGGCTFQQHLTFSLGFIYAGNYDIVVLQEQSQLPAFPSDQFMQESYPYAQQLCELIRQYNPNAKIYFYMTWGRKNGDAQNCQNYPPLCTYEGMDSLLYARYMMMAQDNEACVSPVGAVWHYIRDHYPDLDLYQADESHPSYFGSYVAACCFYTSFTGHNPMDIPWNGTLDADVASKAKFAVKSVVYDSLPKWCFIADTVPQDSTGIVSFSSFPETLSVFPNPAQNHLTYIIQPNIKPNSLTIYDMMGKSLYHSSTFDDNDIDVSFLNNGTYLLEISDDKRSYKTTFFIAR